jgi:hypothetical protein
MDLVRPHGHHANVVQGIIDPLSGYLNETAMTT